MDDIKVMKIDDLLLLLEQNTKVIHDLQMDNEAIISELKVRREIGKITKESN